MAVREKMSHYCTHFNEMSVTIENSKHRILWNDIKYGTPGVGAIPIQT
jgi:hypothetical protein